MFALVDSENFYVSCERVFDPSLAHRPVAVLSNNDGCVIARSEQVKALGVKMGVPYFKCRAFLEAHGAKVFSSNYTLYADLSGRVLDVLQQAWGEVEPYSIDEAFATLPDLPRTDLEHMGWALRRQVRQWTGIPVRVGLGPTKTLAKVAQRLAKDAGTAVFCLHDRPDLDLLLASVPVGDVWGIGRRYARKLDALGVHTARQLRDVPIVWAKQHLTIVGARTVLELRGTSCLPLELAAPPRRSLIRSRSFPQTVCDARHVREAVCFHTARAAEKLRAEGLTATALSAFLLADRHKPGYHEARATRTLDLPTNDTRLLMAAAVACMEEAYRAGASYKKAGVLLCGVGPVDARQGHLFVPPPRPMAGVLMHALDRANHRWGRDALRFAATGLARPWQMAQQRGSRCYTTQWRALPRVFA